MNFAKTTLLPIFASGIWINFSEFIRNELILKSYWIDHYQKLGWTFPAAPINGLVWGIWGFSLAMVIFILLKKFTVLQTTLLSWFASFIMMWMVIGNLGVLPGGLLWLAGPLGFIEAFVGALIIAKFPFIKAGSPL